MNPPIPWWRIATLTILTAALIISLTSGRTIEAVIIAILMVPTILLIGAWLYQRNTARDRRI